jgi:3-dehydroquinate dehydratase-2
MDKIAIINGPNLNLLGKREPHIYGNTSFIDYLAALKSHFADAEILYFQSNSEGELIDAIQSYGYDPAVKGIVLNPGAYAHYSYALADAVGAIPAPVVEVHISNIYAREEFRRTSVVSERCKAVFAGAGLLGYRLAIETLLAK